MLDHLTGLRTEIGRFQAAVADLDASVPSCPAWRVRDLVYHLGSVHRTFRRVADEGWLQRPPRLKVDDRPPVEDDHVVEWAAREADMLVEAMERLEPDAPRWNFSPGPQIGAFIPRRMHHETTIHRWDLETTFGPTTAVETEVAIDGIAEYLEVYLPRSGVWNGPSATLLTEVVGGPSFSLTLEPDQVATVGTADDRDADVVVRGEPGPLLLAWWDRLPLEDCRTLGSAELLATVRQFSYT